MQLPPVHEEWVIDANKQAQWRSLLAQNDLTQEKMARFFADRHLARLSFGETVASGSHYRHSPAQNRPELLWSDAEVEVYAPAEPRVRHHLWVVLKRPVGSFAEVTKAEAVALRQTVNKIEGVLKSHFEMPAVVAQYNEPQPGQLAERFTIEVIPPRLDSRNVLNVVDKVDCNNYVLFRNLYPPEPGPTATEQMADAAFWHRALRTAPPPFSTETESEPIRNWTQIQTNKWHSFQKLLNAMEQIAREAGIEIQRRPLGPEPADTPVTHEKVGCPFCRAAVIEAQRTIETDHFNILYTFKPAIPDYHLLIVPKRHVASSDHLRQDEIEEMHDIAQRLAALLIEKGHRTDVKMYIQDGPAVGQTVAHTQMQIMLTPPRLRYQFHSMFYDWETPLTAEQMKPVLDDFAARWKKRG